MSNPLKSLLDRVFKSDPRTAVQFDDDDPASDFPWRKSRPRPAHVEVFSDRSSSRPAGITFRVDEVEPATTPLPQVTLGAGLERRCGSSILVMPDRDHPTLAPQRTSASFLPARGTRVVATATVAPEQCAETFLHPLIHAVHQAFSDHRPLVLSPDAIWLTIAQGFGHHVAENAVALRQRMVQHEGKKKLEIETRSLEQEAWPGMIAQLCGQIRENSDPVLYESLICDFSTTTPTIRTASHVSLMDAYRRYFDYEIGCVCGIPRVTLEGTAEDWQRMRERVEVLATYDLEWWTSSLIPILDQFVVTGTGNPDLAFWQAIYKPQDAYASKQATGWITGLFPYLDSTHQPKRFRNHTLRSQRIDWLQLDRMRGMPMSGIPLSAFPTGLSQAQVKLKFKDLPAEDVNLMGGFFGVSQRPEDNALSPVISWAVMTQEREENQLAPITSHEQGAD